MNRLQPMLLAWLMLAGHAVTGADFASSHDPSTIQRENGRYWLFHTGTGLRSSWSHDLTNWMEGPRVFTTPLAWWTREVPEFNMGHLWAPDVIRVGDRYLLYYSVSTFGSQVSAIGLAVNEKLDPTDPRCRWVDRGPVLNSRRGMAYNAIDPAPFLDADGRLWLVFGSFWKGIFVTELDPASGLRKHPSSHPAHLAAAPHGSTAIEAAYVYRHGPSYFLFVNWGQCCQGVNSTYEIRMGRSARLDGPYLDRTGQPLASGGGSPFLARDGRFIGPGHVGIYTEGTNTWLSHHFYDGEQRGRRSLRVRALTWDADGWPRAGE